MMFALMGILFVFAGCKDEDDQLEPLKKVTVSGAVQAELDLSNAGLEPVPNGTKILFRINSMDLVQTPIAGYTYEILQYSTTVTDGEYTIDLPAVKFNSATVSIIPVDFQAEQLQADDSKKDKTYVGIATTLNISEGQRYFKNVNYADI